MPPPPRVPTIAPSPNGTGRIVTHPDGRRVFADDDAPFALEIGAGDDGLSLTVTPRPPKPRPTKRQP